MICAYPNSCDHACVIYGVVPLKGDWKHLHQVARSLGVNGGCIQKMHLAEKRGILDFAQKPLSFAAFVLRNGELAVTTTENVSYVVPKRITKMSFILTLLISEETRVTQKVKGKIVATQVIK